jgi:hypothetical protein
VMLTSNLYSSQTILQMFDAIRFNRKMGPSTSCASSDDLQMMITRSPCLKPIILLARNDSLSTI